MFPVILLMYFTSIVGKSVIIGEPKTNKDCYVEGENGTLSLSFEVINLSLPLDRFMVIWNTKLDGKGTKMIEGTTVHIYDNRDDKTKQDARWTLITKCSNRTVSYTMEISELYSMDDQGALFPRIFDRRTGKIIAKAHSYARLTIENTCPDVPSSSYSTSMPVSSENTTIKNAEETKRTGQMWDVLYQKYVSLVSRKNLHLKKSSIVSEKNIQYNEESICYMNFNHLHLSINFRLVGFLTFLTSENISP